jgi:hypothetical protein
MISDVKNTTNRPNFILLNIAGLEMVAWQHAGVGMGKTILSRTIRLNRRRAMQPSNVHGFGWRNTPLRQVRPPRISPWPCLRRPFVAGSISQICGKKQHVRRHAQIQYLPSPKKVNRQTNLTCFWPEENA